MGCRGLVCGCLGCVCVYGMACVFIIWESFAACRVWHLGHGGSIEISDTDAIEGVGLHLDVLYVSGTCVFDCHVLVFFAFHLLDLFSVSIFSVACLALHSLD